ncbi:MAG TPA: tetratricopeptide repeat protein [Gammaproteobacteria bacterium]|nr:tetratricopeptide repeat protein [Gammaproteobacteria bacterium]HEV2614641.1 tetratricopeptide repeat protein [Gammaproteobacteria bacterium]
MEEVPVLREDVPVPKSEVEKLKQQLAAEIINTLAWCQLRGKLAKAQYELFCDLESTDPRQAVLLLYDSANIGYEPARRRLYPETKSEKREKIDLKSLSAYEVFILGLQARSGVGRKINLRLAFDCFTRAAAQGYKFAQYELGNMFLEGIYVAQNDNKAVECFQAAVDQDYAPAQYMLGLMYQSGCVGEAISGGFSHGLKEMLSEVLVQSDHGFKKNYVAEQEESRRDRLKIQGTQLFQAAANQGYADAQVALVEMLADRLVNRDEKFNGLQRAAEQGHVLGQAYLGVMYCSLRNPDEGFKWRRKAAEEGGPKTKKRLIKHLTLEIAQNNDFITRYHLAALENSKRGFIQLLNENPNEFLRLLKLEYFIHPNSHFNIIKELFTQKTDDIPYDINFRIDLAEYLYSVVGKMSKVDAAKLIGVLIPLFESIPNDHAKYPGAQVILAHLNFLKNQRGVEWQEHLLQAAVADSTKEEPRHKVVESFRELPAEIEKQKEEMKNKEEKAKRKAKWDAEKQSLLRFWRGEESLFPESEKKGDKPAVVKKKIGK